MAKHRRKADTGINRQILFKRMKNNAHLLILLAVGLLVGSIMHAAAPMGQNVINNEVNAVFAKEWQYRINDGVFSEISLPTSKKTDTDSRITLKNQIPEELIKGATILLRTSQQDAKVYVERERVYCSNESEKSNFASTSAYHFVRLPVDCAGKEITVILSSHYENYAGFMNQIYIGSKASNVFFLVKENGFRFIIGFLIFSIGFLLMLMFMFVKARENKAAIIYLGAFFVCSGYWVMVESKMLQFIIPYPVSLTNSSIFALSLLPIFSGLYYYNTCNIVWKKTTKYVLGAVSVTSAALAVASCINPMLPLNILNFYLAFMGIYVVFLFASIIIESKKADKFFSTSVCGVMAFGICTLLELASYFSDMHSYNESNFLTFGLLLFCAAMVVDTVQNFAKVQQAAVKVDALSVLAYTDSLTQLKNRTAFLEEMSKTEIDEERDITIAMFDINNLKEVNDTLGHLAGDAMLRQSAKAIKNSLRQEDEVYRIGGDEFVSILHHSKNFDTDSFEKRMLFALAQENLKPRSYDLSIAYGYATFSKDIDKTLFETLSRADEKMYIRKKMQKSVGITFR